MAAKYARHVSPKQTPQTEPIPGTSQVANSAGGYSWAVDDWVRLERFLVLGSEGGSYYATERKLTIENATCIERCAKEDGLRTVATIVDFSKEGRAPKNDPAIFALAVVAKVGDAITKKLAYDAVPSVCRIGTHLFQFAEACKAMRGWGSGLRRAIAHWYQTKQDLAYQVVKYQNRNGWSHHDLMHMSHPKFTDETRNAIAHWAKNGWKDVGDTPHENKGLLHIWAFERAKRADKKEVCRLIREYDMPREAIPTQFLTEPEVWEALLERMPMHAMVRNLANMTRAGVLAPLSDGTKKVMAELSDTERIRKSRLHPVAVLSALLTYKSGKSAKGSNTWTPVPQIVDALDGAFYHAFGNVEPTGKRWLLALDASASMTWSNIAGVEGLTPRVGSAAMSMITAAVESQHHFMAFASGIMTLSISPRQRLDDVCRSIERLPASGTDCALPMIYAMQHGIPVDVFVVYTDSETYQGNIHASQALVQYRQKTGIPAKLIVVGMVSNGFTIADPNDAGMMDVVGFDTAAPQVMSQFAVS